MGYFLGGVFVFFYVMMFYYIGQIEIVFKIGVVYIFGQFCVGDQDFVNYVNFKFKGKFFCVVYCNDVVF